MWYNQTRAAEEAFPTGVVSLYPSPESSPPYQWLLPGSTEVGVWHPQDGKMNGGHGSETGWQESILTSTEKSKVKIHIPLCLLVFTVEPNFWLASVSELADKLWLVMWCRERMLSVARTRILQKGKTDLLIRKPGKSHNIHMQVYWCLSLKPEE